MLDFFSSSSDLMEITFRRSLHTVRAIITNLKASFSFSFYHPLHINFNSPDLIIISSLANVRLKKLSLSFAYISVEKSGHLIPSEIFFCLLSG